MSVVAMHAWGLGSETTLAAGGVSEGVSVGVARRQLSTGERTTSPQFEEDEATYSESSDRHSLGSMVARKRCVPEHLRCNWRVIYYNIIFLYFCRSERGCLHKLRQLDRQQSQ